MSSWRSLVLLALLTLFAVPALAGRTGGCPYKSRASFQLMPRGHWAYEAVWELGRGSHILGDWNEQRSLQAFSRHHLCRFHFARLTAKLLKHRSWRRRGEALTPALLERLAALISEFRHDFAMMGGRPERLDLMFAQVLREEDPLIRALAPVTIVTLPAPRKHRRSRAPRAPMVMGLLAMLVAAGALKRLETRSATSSTMLATRFSI